MQTTPQPPKSQLEFIEDRLFENLAKYEEFNCETIRRLTKLAKDGYLSNVSKVGQIIKADAGGKSEAN